MAEPFGLGGFWEGEPLLGIVRKISKSRGLRRAGFPEIRIWHGDCDLGWANHVSGRFGREAVSAYFPEKRWPREGPPA
jgi:hypothetical protein